MNLLAQVIALLKARGYVFMTMRDLAAEWSRRPARDPYSQWRLVPFENERLLTVQITNVFEEVEPDMHAAAEVTCARHIDPRDVAAKVAPGRGPIVNLRPASAPRRGERARSPTGSGAFPARANA